MDQKYCVYCLNQSDSGTCSSCGKDSTAYQTAPHHLQPGTMLNSRYLIGSVLGEGGFGITYIGRDVNLDIRVAIKEYFPTGAVNRNNISSSEVTANIGSMHAFFEKGKASFLTEARTLAKFSSENSIVTVHDFFSANNTAYIVMEYLEGTDLKDYLANHGKMSFADAYGMLAPVLTALDKVHESGLIHRDISPANVMILKNGSVKLLDFGAARDVSGSDEKSLSVLLKPGYAPEEQYRTKGKQGPWTDVYALSATLYKMLTGVTPDDAMNRLFSDELQRITELNPLVTPEQEAAVMKGMAVQQAERYQTVAELQNACLKVLNSQSSADDYVTVGADEATWSPNIQSLHRPAPKCSAQRDNVNPVYRPQEKTPEKNDESTVSAAELAKRTEPKGKAHKNIGEKGSATQTDGAASPAANHDGQKKPSRARLIGSAVSGVIALLIAIAIVLSMDPDYTGGLIVFSGILAVAFAALAVFLGKSYFSRIDNKSLKPNIPCFILSIVAGIATIVPIFLLFISNDKSGSAIYIMTSIAFAIITWFFGYFYYPRLTKKRRKLFIRLYGMIAATAVVALIVFVVFTGLNTINIGDTKVKRNAEEVSISGDIISDNDIAKLKDLKKLRKLYLEACLLDNDDVAIIGELSNLETLYLDGNIDITDISPLNNLTKLKALDLSATSVDSISCLDKLTELECLKVNRTDITDLHTVSSYKNLETLSINSLEGLDQSTISLPDGITSISCENNGIHDIGFLSGKTKLYSIHLANNEIIDLSPLSGLDNIWTLDLSNNKISDIAPIPKESLQDLKLKNNSVSDISSLSNATEKLNKLDLGFNKISDISALYKLYGIYSLYINNNEISDISALSECFRIEELDISYNLISDISVIASIDNLKSFSARGNQIDDISALAETPLLKDSDMDIDLRNNKITDVTPLSNFKTRRLYLSNNNISDVSPLATCTEIETLYLNKNNISNVSPLFNLSKLYRLEIVYNPVADLSSISLTPGSLFNTAILLVSYNESIDWEALSQIEYLQVLICDAPEREKDSLKSLGYGTISSDDLDEDQNVNADDTNAETGNSETETDKTEEN